MAATPPPPSFSVAPNKSLKPRHSHSPLLQNRFCSNSSLRCEIRSFENHRNWTIEHVSDMNKDSTILSNNNNNNSSSSASSLVSSAAASASQLSTKNAKRVVLFYCAETKSLADKIAAQSDTIELRTISWGFVSFIHTTATSLFWFSILTNVAICFHFPSTPHPI